MYKQLSKFCFYIIFVDILEFKIVENKKELLISILRKRMVTSRKWVLVKHFEGVPKDDDMQLVEEELSDDLKENG